MPDKERFALAVAGLLFAHGQTTEGMRATIAALGRTYGAGFQLVAGWDGLMLLSDRLPAGVSVGASPLGVDIGRVAAAESVAQCVIAGTRTAQQGFQALDLVRHARPVGLLRFAVMAAGGAASLAVIFGAADPRTLGMTAVAAGVALGLDVSHRLVAVCPCMVLVPGPHLLNGAIDLARSRIALGAARLMFAGLVILAICAGLLLGLAANGSGLSPGGPPSGVPLVLDVGAACLAVAAYGSFFNMRWGMLPIPIATGMLAHALRWGLLAHGVSVQAGAFAACLLVSAVMSPVSRRLRLPFGALAFASVVSLMPGIFLFQAAAEATALSAGGLANPATVLLDLVGNGTTAGLILLGMAGELVLPKVICQ